MGRLLEIAKAAMTVAARSCTVPVGEREITVADLTPDWRVEFEERAAIREYDGGQLREYAEAEALRETIERMQAAGMIPKKKLEPA